MRKLVYVLSAVAFFILIFLIFSIIAGTERISQGGFQKSVRYDRRIKPKELSKDNSDEEKFVPPLHNINVPPGNQPPSFFRSRTPQYILTGKNYSSSEHLAGGCETIPERLASPSQAPRRIGVQGGEKQRSEVNGYTRRPFVSERDSSFRTIYTKIPGHPGDFVI